MKILVAIDSSEFSAAVVDEVLNRQWRPGTEVKVLTVVDLFALTYSVGYMEGFLQQEHLAARAMLSQAANRFAAQGLSVTTDVVEGYPSTEIVNAAQEWGADFIFIGSHGHGGFVRFFVGSVAKRVLHSAHCSVDVIRKTERTGKQPYKILFATDGSDFSIAAAKSIAQREWVRGTEVRIISVADLVVPAIEPWYSTGRMAQQIQEATIAQAEAAVTAAKAILAPTKLKVSAEVLTGYPKARIPDEATEFGADLVVVGSHGRRGLTRLFLGSVSEAVALRSHCSVEIIRPSGELI
jgi:nucleotide-binding universal stress UspA family protein